MLFYTHIAFSILIGLFLLDYISIQNKIIFFVFLILFSVLADIDASRSKIGKKFGLFSRFINWVFGHRHLFHSFLFLIFGYIVLSIFSEMIGLAFLIGMGSHLVLDALTPLGVVPFYPFKFRVKGMIKTSSMLEKLLFFVFVVLIIVKLSTGQV